MTDFVVELDRRYPRVRRANGGGSARAGLTPIGDPFGFGGQMPIVSGAVDQHEGWTRPDRDYSTTVRVRREPAA